MHTYSGRCRYFLLFTCNTLIYGRLSAVYQPFVYCFVGIIFFFFDTDRNYARQAITKGTMTRQWENEVALLSGSLAEWNVFINWAIGSSSDSFRVRFRRYRSMALRNTFLQWRRQFSRIGGGLARKDQDFRICLVYIKFRLYFLVIRYSDCFVKI